MTAVEEDSWELLSAAAASLQADELISRARALVKQAQAGDGMIPPVGLAVMSAMAARADVREVLEQILKSSTPEQLLAAAHATRAMSIKSTVH